MKIERESRATARIAGHDAFKSGKSKDANPYEPATDMFVVWLAGYEQAEHDDYKLFQAARHLSESNMDGHSKMVASTQAWIRGDLKYA